MASGESVMVIEDDFGFRKDLDTGLAVGGTAQEIYRIHPDNPQSAYMETSWTQELMREGWHVRTATDLTMWSDSENFHMIARIEAYDGEELIFEKDWNETLPRGFL